MKWIIYGQKMIEQSENERLKSRNENKNAYSCNVEGRTVSEPRQ